MPIMTKRLTSIIWDHICESSALGVYKTRIVLSCNGKASTRYDEADGTSGLRFVNYQNTMHGTEDRYIDTANRKVLYCAINNTDAQVRPLDDGITIGAALLSGNDFIDDEMDNAFREVLNCCRAAMMEYYARYDDLTGVYCRRYFRERAEKFLRRTYDGYDILFSIVDIDYFKQVNDVYGHDCGDEVLVKFSRACQKSVILLKDAINDEKCKIVLGRHGGEEFTIISVIPKGFGDRFMDEFRKFVYSSPVSDDSEDGETVQNIKAGGSKISVEFSAGYVIITNGMSRKDVESFADKALYKAKACGRNMSIDFSSIKNEWGRVIDHHISGVVIIDIGSIHRVQVGDIFTIYDRDLDKQVDYYQVVPGRSKHLGAYPKIPSAEIRVISSEKEVSFCEVSGFNTFINGRINSGSHLKFARSAGGASAST